MLQNFCGNTELISSLQRSISSGELSHAVLLCGADGLGRNYLSRLLAAEYLYPDGGHLAKAVLRDESSDVTVIQGQGKSGQISVASVREMRAGINLSSFSDVGKVILVRDAHNMTASSANALLKVLEEPPSDVLFILTAQAPGSLPATILSRCTVYTLAPVSISECCRFLESSAPSDTPADLPNLLSCVYGGRIGLGLSTLRSPDAQAVLQDAMQISKAAVKKDEYALLQLFSLYEGKTDEDKKKRNMLVSHLLSVLNASFHNTPGLTFVHPNIAAQLLRFCDTARVSLLANASPKLVFTTLCVDIILADFT